MNRYRRRYRRSRCAVLALALALAGCGGSADEDALTPRPAGSLGLLLVDCWNDTLTPLNAVTAERGPSYRTTTANPAVRPAPLCGRRAPESATGVTPYSPDGTLLTAVAAGDDGSTHAGYLTVATGAFVDLSVRVELDAAGHFTDKGSDAEAFAGPVKDTALGFGPDGSFYLERVGIRHFAVGPGFEAFRPVAANDVIGLAAPDGRTVADTAAGVVLSLPAGTPAGSVQTDGGTANDVPGHALLVTDDDNYLDGLDCGNPSWIDGDHLLCSDGGDTADIVDLTGATLVPAATSFPGDAGEAESTEDEVYCSPCDGRSYVWRLPADAVSPATGDTTRELFGFVADPIAGQVYFLADNGSTMLLYSVEPGGRPVERGSIPIGDDPSGSSWTDLMIR